MFFSNPFLHDIAGEGRHYSAKEEMGKDEIMLFTNWPSNTEDEE